MTHDLLLGEHDPYQVSIGERYDVLLRQRMELPPVGGRDLRTDKKRAAGRANRPSIYKQLATNNPLDRIDRQLIP